MLEILLVDDEPSILIPFNEALRAEGHSVVTATDGVSALAALSSRSFDVVISDIRLPRMDGFTLFQQAHKDSPSTRFILMTAYSNVPQAVAALKEGAADYLAKPFDLDDLLARLSAIAGELELKQELEAARSESGIEEPSGFFVGRSPGMMRVFDLIEKFGVSDAPVLITGESGTGKELVARGLHARSARRDRAFVAVNCAAFPETLLEAELFGHERGAFTGAVKAREGRFKAADTGTLFLDEVAEIPLPAQAKLLRVLQDKIFQPLGTNQNVSVDVRILSATHRNLKEFVSKGRFREDLYYRLKVLELEIPPLREHRGDLPSLVLHFLSKFGTGAKSPGISARALGALSGYSFPGNVRELEHAIQHASILAAGAEVDLEHLPAEIAGEPSGDESSSKQLRSLPEAVREFEREYLRRAVQLAGGKRTRAASLLGISRKSLWEKLRGYGLSEAEIDPAVAGDEEEKVSPPRPRAPISSVMVGRNGKGS